MLLKDLCSTKKLCNMGIFPNILPICHLGDWSPFAKDVICWCRMILIDVMMLTVLLFINLINMGFITNLVLFIIVKDV